MTTSPALFLAACLVALPLAAATAPPGASPLDERISIDLKDANPGDALRSFSQLTGLKFTVDPGVKTPFTASLHNVRVRTALDVLCESVGCSWAEIPGNPPTVRVISIAASAASGSAEQAAVTVPPGDVLDQVISLELNDAGAADVLKSFGQILTSEVVVGPPAFDGKVTIALKEVPVRAALEGVCAQLGCAWDLDRSGSPSVLRVRHSPS